MKSLKIGVLTFHRCINYGSYWQARCLVEGLLARGHDAAILDHDSAQINIAEWKCAYQPVLPTPVPASDYPLYRKKINGFFRSFNSLPLTPRFNLNDPAKMDNYDTIVVGSDEVWNLFHPWYGRCPLFFGDGLRGKQLVSYAASFGNYDASWQLEPTWGEKLKQFTSISVRDENSQRIVKNAIGEEATLVLDPCLQFPVYPDERNLEALPKKYVAVYGHNFSDFFIKQIKDWAAHRSLPLVSIGYRNDWVDKQWITADPHDFAHFMARSQAVVTNFFHGCVFALRNTIPFVCETTLYRGNKLNGLLAKTGSKKHLADETTPVDQYYQCLNEPLANDILENIGRLRQASSSYLTKALHLNNANHLNTANQYG
ncbi:MAG: polysaccharide pyruvyl transferase family protein [Ferruginibacter sp.]